MAHDRANPHRNQQPTLHTDHTMDHLDMYEACVQSPRYVTRFLRVLHGNEPRVLREDFCGTAAVSREWAAESAARNDDGRAVAVDFDEETLARARLLANQREVASRIVFRQDDCITLGSHDHDACDIIFVGNFSIGYIHTRAALVSYLRTAHQRLSRGNGGFGGGLFTCDIYGGANAFRTGGIERRHTGPGHELIHYIWRHDEANPITGMVRNSISFRLEVGGEVIKQIADAFTYHWRLWSLTELSDAMLEAGFNAPSIYKDIRIAPEESPQPITTSEALGEDWVVLLAASTA